MLFVVYRRPSHDPMWLDCKWEYISSWWSGFESCRSRLRAMFGWHDLVFAVREQA